MVTWNQLTQVIQENQEADACVRSILVPDAPKRVVGEELNDVTRCEDHMVNGRFWEPRDGTQ